MFAQQNDSTRLQAFGALGMLRDKTHLVANGQLVEVAIRNTVSMEINLAAVRTRDKAAISPGQKPRDTFVVGNDVPLYVSAPFASMIFEQPTRRVKSVADRDMGILMCVVGPGIAAHDDLSSRNLEVDAHLEQIPLLPPRVAAFDDHPARNDSIKKAIKLLGALTYPHLNRLRSLHVAEGDLKW
jgi:hypothetical protein